MGKINSSIGALAQNADSPNTVKKFVVDDPTATAQPGLDALNDIKQAPPPIPPIRGSRRLNYGAQEQQQNNPQAHERIDVAEGDDIFEKVEEVRKTREALDPEKKNKLEILLGLKRKYGNLEIDDHTITLRNLSAKESKVLVKSAFSMQEENRKVDQLFDIRNYTLAFALYAIDDVKISDILGMNDTMEMRLSMIEEMPEAAISELHEFYEKNIAVRQPQTEHEAKEVMGDIKK